MNLNDIVKYNSESSNIDFKQIEYPLGQDCKKTEFLKDISAMANHPSNEAKFIFVGVVEKTVSLKVLLICQSSLIKLNINSI